MDLLTCPFFSIAQDEDERCQQNDHTHRHHHGDHNCVVLCSLRCHCKTHLYVYGHFIYMHKLTQCIYSVFYSYKEKTLYAAYGHLISCELSFISYNDFAKYDMFLGQRILLILVQQSSPKHSQPYPYP